LRPRGAGKFENAEQVFYPIAQAFALIDLGYQRYSKKVLGGSIPEKEITSDL